MYLVLAWEFVSNKFPSDAEVAGQGLHSESQWTTATFINLDKSKNIILGKKEQGAEEQIEIAFI